MSSLIVENLSVAYSIGRSLVHAATDVSFTVRSGQVLGLWGHSGCGKTTIMKALLGLPMDEPGWISGKATFGGSNVSPIVDNYIRRNHNGTILKRSVAFHKKHRQLLRPYLGRHWRTLLQEPIYSFESDRPMYEQVDQVLHHFRTDKDDGPGVLWKDFDAVIRRLDLSCDYLRSRRNIQLSGGECQRVGIALCLVGSPKLMLIDEPTTAMDLQTRGIAIGLIRERVQRDGLSVVVSSHNREELLELADDIVVLCRGQVVESFSRTVVNAIPVERFHPYTRKLWFLYDTDDMPKDRPSQMVEALPVGCPFVHECRFAVANTILYEKCASRKPPLMELSAFHRSACWLAEKK